MLSCLPVYCIVHSSTVQLYHGMSPAAAVQPALCKPFQTRRFHHTMLASMMRCKFSNIIGQPAFCTHLVICANQSFSCGMCSWSCQLAFLQLCMCMHAITSHSMIDCSPCCLSCRCDSAEDAASVHHKPRSLCQCCSPQGCTAAQQHLCRPV